MEKLEACAAAGSGPRRVSHLKQNTTKHTHTLKFKRVRMAQDTSNTHSTISYNKDIAQFKGPVKESDLDAVRAALINPAPSQPLKQGWEIPIIDFSQLRGAHRHLVVDQISCACQEWGFFYVCILLFTSHSLDHVVQWLPSLVHTQCLF